MHIHLIIYWCSRFIPSYMYLKLLKESDPPSLYCALLLLLWCGSIPYLGKHITSCTSEFLIYNTSNPELRNTAVSFVILDPLYHPIPWAPEVFLARFPVSVMSLLWPARKTSGTQGMLHRADETQPGRKTCPRLHFGFHFGLYHVSR